MRISLSVLSQLFLKYANTLEILYFNFALKIKTFWSILHFLEPMRRGKLLK